MDLQLARGPEAGHTGRDAWSYAVSKHLPARPEVASEAVSLGLAKRSPNFLSMRAESVDSRSPIPWAASRGRAERTHQWPHASQREVGQFERGDGSLQVRIG